MKITDEAVLTYLRTNTPKYPEESIVEQLTKAGYKSEDIIETIQSLSSQQSTTQQSSSLFNKPQTTVSQSTQRPLVGDSLAYNKPLPTNIFSKSWFLFSQSWKVLMKDKELLGFTILASILNIIMVAILIVPFFLTNILASVMGSVGPILTYGMMFLIYLGSAFITTFFNTAIVHTVQTRLEGGNPSFGDGISFAMKRLPVILGWAAISATLGLIIRIIESLAERLPLVGQLVVIAIVNLLGLAWSIITLFAVPAMVIQNISPFAAIKESATTLKKTFGQYFIVDLGMGLVFFGLILVGGVIGGGLAIVSGIVLQSFIGVAISLVLMGIYFVATSMVFSTLNQIFRTSVYLYAAKGVVAPAFGEEALKHAFKEKKKPFSGK